MSKMKIPEGDWIQKYLELTENTEPPMLYKEWVACSVIASVLQRKYRFNWGILTFFPNLYIVLVGPSGRCRKGVALSTGQKMLRDLGIKMTAEAVTREALIKDLAESASVTETKKGRRLIHSSLTVFSKELAVFLGHENKNLMSDLTDWYDCDDKWEYRTKGSGVDEIIGVWLNLIGATTPELVQTQLPRDAIGGGLSSRIIFVYEDKKNKKVAAPFLSDKQKQLFEDLKEELEWMYGLSGEVGFDEGFLESYVQWYEGGGLKLPEEYGGTFTKATKDEFSQGPLAYYNERRANHVMRLCIILSASQKQKVVTKQVLFRAIHLLERTEIKMPKTFGGYGMAERSDLLFKLMQIIGEKKKMTKSQLVEIVKYDVDDVSQLDGMIGMLRTTQFCTVRHTEKETVVKFNPDSEAGRNFIKDSVG